MKDRTRDARPVDNGATRSAGQAVLDSSQEDENVPASTSSMPTINTVSAAR